MIRSSNLNSDNYWSLPRNLYFVSAREEVLELQTCGGTASEICLALPIIRETKTREKAEHSNFSFLQSPLSSD